MGTWQDIVAEAKKSKKWIYDPAFKFWYTPEDFQHICQQQNRNKTPEDLVRLQILHPSEGVEAGFKKLEAMQTKLRHMAQRVVEYYSNK